MLLRYGMNIAGRFRKSDAYKRILTWFETYQPTTGGVKNLSVNIRRGLSSDT